MAKQDDYIRYTIRIPAGLYDEIKHAAGEKSVNAEITWRLTYYNTLLDQVEDLESTVRSHDADLAAIVKERDLLQEEVKRLRAAQIATSEAAATPDPKDVSTDENTLYILIDAEGVPTSWAEINAHLENILARNGVHYDQLQAKVFAPDFRSSRDRDDQWIELIEEYRAKRALDRIGKGLAAAKKRRRNVDVGDDTPTDD